MENNGQSVIVFGQSGGVNGYDKEIITSILGKIT